MPTFTYQALSAAGERVAGELEAADGAAAVLHLHKRGLIPINTRLAQAGSPRKHITRDQIMVRHVTQITRELAVALGAGQPLEGALALVGRHLSKRALAQALERVLTRVRSGSNLSAALSEEPRFFSAIYITMVKAGESSGNLAEALLEIAKWRERSGAFNEKLITALIYPAFLVLSLFSAVGILLTFVVPQLGPLFEQAGEALPYSTQIIIAISKFVEKQWLTCGLIILFCLLILQHLLNNSSSRRAFDKIFLCMPVINHFIREALTAQLCRGLATLLAGGLDLPQALVIARDMLGNMEAQAQLETATSQVCTGHRLSDSLIEANIISPIAANMLLVGEESGRLQMVVSHLANAFEEKIQLRLQRFLSILEPVMMISIGIVIGCIIIPIMSAVTTLSNIPIQ